MVGYHRVHTRESDDLDRNPFNYLLVRETLQDLARDVVVSFRIATKLGQDDESGQKECEKRGNDEGEEDLH